MARMGVNAVSWLVQRIFGHSWRSYAIGPFFMAALQVPLIYAIAKRLGGRLAGVLGVLLITDLAMVHRSASQVLPDGYAGTYAILAAYLYLRFVEAPEARKQQRLIELSFAVFLGYLGKETFCFFFPGFVLAVWLVRRRPRDVLIFLGVLSLGFLLETACYSLFTDYSSRYAVIHGTHLVENADAEVSTLTFWDLFQRFEEMHSSSKYLMFFALASALWLATLRKEKQLEGRAIALIGVSHIVCITFMIRSLHPLDVWQGFDPRYMEPATPFLGVYAGVLLAQAATELYALLSPKPEVLARFGPGAGPACAAVWSLSLIGVAALATDSYQHHHPVLDGYVRGKEIADLVNRTYDRNLPILERSRRAKVLTAVYDVYLDDRRLAKAGKLPNLDEVAIVHGGSTVLLKDPSAYGRQTLAQLMDAGCYVDLKPGGGRAPGTRDHRASIRIANPGTAQLPDSCDAVLTGAGR